MALDVTSTESMQWNRTTLITDSDHSPAAEPEGVPPIPAEVLAEVQDAISAEVAKVGS